MVPLYILSLHVLSLAHKAAIPSYSMFFFHGCKQNDSKAFVLCHKSVWQSVQYHVSHKQQFFDRACLQWQPYRIKIEAAVRVSVQGNTVFDDRKTDWYFTMTTNLSQVLKTQNHWTVKMNASINSLVAISTCYSPTVSICYCNCNAIKKNKE